VQVGLTLQYFPIDGTSAPVNVCTTTDPKILRQYRRSLLRTWERRAYAGSADATAAQITKAEADRVRELLDLLIPEPAR
jgi:hypothetical protein